LAEAGSSKTYGKVQGVVQLDAGGIVTLKREEKEFEGMVYQPNQLHVHSPSEHTIDDQYYDLEMHFVMLPTGETESAYKRFAAGQKAKNGDFNYKVNYAVLGVMFRETNCKDEAGIALENCE
jgi:carbonic anhydrase